MQLVNLGGGVGHVKAGFLGFAGSGKTYTAVELALGIRKFLNLPGPLGMFDTEAAAQYVAPRVKAVTGLDLVGAQSRALNDAVDFLSACQLQGVSVAIIDSVTHLWREVCDSYLKQVNVGLEKKGRNPRTRLEFQDWGPIKATWERFSNLYLNIPMHVIIAGRAGYEYDYEQREDGSGKDLIKTGIKMKTEGEFGFEPSLLVEMERIQTDASGALQSKLIHRATVIKDRFGLLDGKECDNPTFEFFKPFVATLIPGARAQVDTTRQTDLGVDESGDAKYNAERKKRAIFCEEIQGVLLAAFPGQSADEKKAKATLIYRLFSTYSWTAVESMEAKNLKAGLDALPAAIEDYKKGVTTKPEKSGAEQIVEAFTGEKGEKKAEKHEVAAAGKGGGK